MRINKDAFVAAIYFRFVKMVCHQDALMVLNHSKAWQFCLLFWICATIVMIEIKIKTSEANLERWHFQRSYHFLKKKTPLILNGQESFFLTASRLWRSAVLEVCKLLLFANKYCAFCGEFPYLFFVFLLFLAVKDELRKVVEHVPIWAETRKMKISLTRGSGWVV